MNCRYVGKDLSGGDNGMPPVKRPAPACATPAATSDAPTGPPEGPAAPAEGVGAPSPSPAAAGAPVGSPIACWNIRSRAFWRWMPTCCPASPRRASASSRALLASTSPACRAPAAAYPRLSPKDPVCVGLRNPSASASNCGSNIWFLRASSESSIVCNAS